MYHALEDEAHPSGAKDSGEHLYVLQVSQFREHMAYLHREGYRTLLLEELKSLTEWPDKAVVLTFDDGHESNFSLALPILRDYGFKADFFITTGWIGTPYYMTERHIRELYRAGMGIGSHGVTHAFFDDMTYLDCQREFCESGRILSEIIGRKVTSFSAPGGRVRPDIAALAESSGYDTVCTSQPGIVVNGGSAYCIPRITLQNDMDMKMFATIVQRDDAYLTRLTRRSRLLSCAKKMLGNKRYEKVRELLLEKKRQ